MEPEFSNDFLNLHVGGQKHSDTQICWNSLRRTSDFKVVLYQALRTIPIMAL